MRSKVHFVLIFIFSFISFSFGQESNFPKRFGFINDFENLLTIDQYLNLESKLIDYENQTSNEIVIVTISEIVNETDFYTYTHNLSKDWAVGKTQKDNGLVIVISNKLRKIRIYTGNGTEKILTDEICSTILNEIIIPKLKNNEVFIGIESGINSLIEKWK